MRVFNPRNVPATYGDARVIGGGEWAEVDRTDDIDRLIEEGHLVEVDAVSEYEADTSDENLTELVLTVPDTEAQEDGAGVIDPATISAKTTRKKSEKEQ